MAAEELASRAVASRRAVAHANSLAMLMANASQEELAHAVEALPYARRQMLLQLAAPSCDGNDRLYVESL